MDVQYKIFNSERKINSIIETGGHVPRGRECFASNLRSVRFRSSPYKGKNKGRGRYNRRKRYIDGKSFDAEVPKWLKGLVL